MVICNKCGKESEFNETIVCSKGGICFWVRKANTLDQIHSFSSSLFKHLVNEAKDAITLNSEEKIQKQEQNKKTAEEKLKICLDCPILNNPNCKICGCNVYLKTKFSHEKCPIGKW